MGRGTNNQLLEVEKTSAQLENSNSNLAIAKLIILCGVPGVGKSTWIKNYQPNSRVVSSDSIRLELFKSLVEANQGSNPSSKHALVFKIFYDRIVQGLKEGETVIADATNLRARDRKKLKQIADQENALSKLVVFENIERAQTNNLNRDLDQQVPEQVMETMINRFKSSITNLKNEDYSEIEIIK